MAQHPSQPDLFAAAAAEGAACDPELVALARRDLAAMLDHARAAVVFPWRDYTQSTLAELRFDGLLRALPEADRPALYQAYADELDRLYALEDAKAA